jgi:two-component system, chemotaxis family, chemotaxis protein CheY
MRVLVVDDSATMRRIVRAHLRALGFETVIEADSGTAALTHVRGGAVDLVIADWAMPGMTGVDLARAIRSNPASAQLPILMVTGMGQEDDIQEAAEAGVDGYVVKPFDLETLRSRLRQVLAHRTAPAAAPGTPRPRPPEVTQ